jgi:DnaJ-domain-containing protein 1
MARRGTTPRRSAADTNASYPCADPPPPQKVFELDLYAILGVSIMATEDEIRRSWKKRAFENHPDQASQRGGSGGRHDTLSDHSARV